MKLKSFALLFALAIIGYNISNHKSVSTSGLQSTEFEDDVEIQNPQSQITALKQSPARKVKTLNPSQKKAVDLSQQIGQLSEDSSRQQKIESIQAILKIDRKALKNSYEKAAFEQALMNDELVLTSKAILTTYYEPKNTKELLAGQRERMDAALFLTRALEWQSNPKWDSIASDIADIILDDSINEIQSLEYKKSLAADRIELFANLKDINRERGLEIERQANSEIAQKIITFANNFYKLNKGN